MTEKTPWNRTRKAVVFGAESTEIISETHGERFQSGENYRNLQVKFRRAAGRESKSYRLEIAKLQLYVEKMSSDKNLMALEKNPMALEFRK